MQSDGILFTQLDMPLLSHAHDRHCSRRGCSIVLISWLLKRLHVIQSSNTLKLVLYFLGTPTPPAACGNCESGAGEEVRAFIASGTSCGATCCVWLWTDLYVGLRLDITIKASSLGMFYSSTLSGGVHMTSAFASLCHPPHRHLLHCNMTLSIWVRLISSLDRHFGPF